MSDQDRGYEPRLHRRQGTPLPGSDAALNENGTGMRRVRRVRGQRCGASGSQRVKAVLLAVEATVDVAVAGADEVEGFVPAACAGPGCC